jgi:hypothetical protein
VGVGVVTFRRRGVADERRLRREPVREASLEPEEELRDLMLLRILDPDELRAAFTQSSTHSCESLSA